MLTAVFMGSPEFAVPSLVATHQKCKILGVYTQPDKPRGRGNKLSPTPVKAKALELGLEVFEPQRIRDEAVVEQLRQWNPDVILVVAYAKLIPKVILDLPRLGCINVHPSLLPKFRGAVPVMASIMAGETETGVCTFFMDEGYDTGDVIHFHKTPLGPQETGQELLDRLSYVGATVLQETIDQLEQGTFQRSPQPSEAVGGYSKQLKKEDLLVPWQGSALQVSNFIRALAKDPGAGSNLAIGDQSLMCKFSKTSPCAQDQWSAASVNASPGQVLALEKNRGLVVATGQGAVLIEEIKPAGKGWLNAWSWVQGGQVQVGSLFRSA